MVKHPATTNSASANRLIARRVPARRARSLSLAPCYARPVAHVLRLTLTNGEHTQIVLPGGSVPPSALLEEFLNSKGEFNTESGWLRVEGDDRMKYVHRSAVASVE